MFIGAAVARPDQALLVLVGGPLVIGVVGWARLRKVRLEVSATTVLVNQGWYRPEVQAARTDISAIHVFPRVISFRGPDIRVPLMKIAPDYTVRQMLEVAEELGVPLYDHRRWLGLRLLSTGRLVNPQRVRA
jgi:hypothetical protein